MMTATNRFPSFNFPHVLKHTGKTFVVTEELCFPVGEGVAKPVLCAVVRRHNGHCVCDAFIQADGVSLKDITFVSERDRKSNRTRQAAVRALEAAGYR